MAMRCVTFPCICRDERPGQGAPKRHKHTSRTTQTSPPQRNAAWLKTRAAQKMREAPECSCVTRGVPAAQNPQLLAAAWLGHRNVQCHHLYHCEPCVPTHPPHAQRNCPSPSHACMPFTCHCMTIAKTCPSPAAFQCLLSPYRVPHAKLQPSVCACACVCTNCTRSASAAPSPVPSPEQRMRIPWSPSSHPYPSAHPGRSPLRGPAMQLHPTHSAPLPSLLPRLLLCVNPMYRTPTPTPAATTHARAASVRLVCPAR